MVTVAQLCYDIKIIKWHSTCSSNPQVLEHSLNARYHAKIFVCFTLRPPYNVLENLVLSTHFSDEESRQCHRDHRGRSAASNQTPQRFSLEDSSNQDMTWSGKPFSQLPKLPHFSDPLAEAHLVARPWVDSGSHWPSQLWSESSDSCVRLGDKPDPSPQVHKSDTLARSFSSHSRHVCMREQVTVSPRREETAPQMHSLQKDPCSLPSRTCLSLAPNPTPHSLLLWDHL